jgi:L-rhamnose-H+ transport protein
MSIELGFGVLAVIFGGFLQGIFAVPMKHAPRWKYEHIWLIFSFSGMVLFPWILALTTLPHTRDVYSLTSSAALLKIAGFGLCWGIGATLTGIGLTLLGIGLGMAIILGLSASLGSLIPLLILHPENLHTHQGRTYLAGTAIMLVGIAVSAKAGILRDAIRNRENARSGGSFVAGFTVCCLSGLFSSALNFSYAFGGEAVERARDLGARPLWSANAITALAVSGGFVANFVYCAYLLAKNGNAGAFVSSGAGVGWWCGALMGVFWFGGQTLYGIGISQIGQLGVVIGWALLMGMIIVTSNAAGVITGEWDGVSPATKRFLGGGMVIILVALAVLAIAQRSA